MTIAAVLPGFGLFILADSGQMDWKFIFQFSGNDHNPGNEREPSGESAGGGQPNKGIRKSGNINDTIEVIIAGGD